MDYPVFLPINGAGNDDTVNGKTDLEISLYMMYAEASGEIREIDADEYMIIETISRTYVCYLTKMGGDAKLYTFVWNGLLLDINV